MTDLDKYFPNIIGQKTVKRQLTFYLDCYKETGIFTNSIFIAPKGCGKTLLAKKLAKNLKSKITGKPKKFIEINCATLNNTRQWVNQVVIPHMIGKEVTILFDEASEIPKELAMNLLTILNPNNEEKNTFSIDNFTYEFNFKLHTFLFATTEPQCIFHALLDRLEKIELEEYSCEELGQIIEIGLPKGFGIEEDTLGKVAKTLRGNARAAQSMSAKIKYYLMKNKRRVFTSDDWRSLKYTLGILPLGLSPIEHRVLNILKRRGPGSGFSLTELSSITGLTRRALQGDIERYLLRNDLMHINTSGRVISERGLDYIETINDDK